MKSKITTHNYKIDLLKGVLPLVLLMLSFADAFGQAPTVTSVSPTRVTNGSRVTVTGTGFVATTTVSINNNITINSITRTPNEISFTIGNLTGDDRPGTLTVGGVSGGIINYIGPKEVTLSTTSDFFVKEIYTNWNYSNQGFWSSKFYQEASGTAKNATSPNDKHELLGYKMSNDIIYSTGVDDNLLEAKLVESGILYSSDLEDPLKYRSNVFKAYSTNGVNGKTRGDTYIIAADMMDGMDGFTSPPGSENSTQEQFQTLTEIKNLTILEAIIDGKNGLELGTGITNFNRDDEVQFFSGNGTPGAIGDGGTPDLLITQIADAGSRDIYYYVDDENNVVGRPISLYINHGTKNTILSKWKMNLYSFTNGQDFATATPIGRSPNYNSTQAQRLRDIRMAAFKLEDFDITTQQQVESIENINMSAGGSADIAFMAYNAASFDIRGPVAAKAVLPQYICQVNGTSSVKFIVIEGKHVGIEDDSQPDGIRIPSSVDTTETFSYQLWKDINHVTNMSGDPSSLTIDNVSNSKLGVYKLRIENGQGLVIIPVELAEGGVPHTWNGASWEVHEDYGTAVADKDRNLFFAANYDAEDLIADSLEGCDCYVASGANVTIGTGKVMKLYGKIEVYEGTVEDQENEIPFTPAGTFTLEDNASLIQTKEVEENENTGNIIVKRDATGLKQYDYVYWSSPVEEGKLSDIPGATSHVYKWEVNQANSNQTPGTVGNWFTEPSGVMQNGRGYIKRVNDASNINASFEGVPNNGNIGVPVYQTESSGSSAMTESNKHWNLIGNPYPSAINPEMFLEDNKDLVDVIQVWVHKNAPSDTADDAYYQDFKLKYSNDYLTYNLVGPTDHTFNGFIASGQGFMVKAVEDGDVKFTNAMRFDANTGEAHDNSQFFREANESNSLSNHDKEKQLIWIALTDETKMATVALIGYAEGATNGKDRLYDASSGSGDMRIYSILDASDFIIQGRALPFEESDQVPLGIEILKNGIYKIGIDHLKGSIMLNEEQGIYLEDTYNNVIHDLRTTPYSFTASKGDIKDRFVLRYTNRSLSVDDQKMAETFVYIKNEQLYVKASKNIEAVVVYDLTGKRVMDHKVSGITDAINTPFQFPKGVYLAEIKLENVGPVTKKVMH